MVIMALMAVVTLLVHGALAVVAAAGVLLVVMGISHQQAVVVVYDQEVQGVRLYQELQEH